jgi:DNA-binding response OmpR family regulator
MKRRILLVDDEVAVLLTLKAILEISGFDVDTAASARDAKLKLRNKQYAMVITDMRMENDAAGKEVILAARKADYHPAIALLTAFPLADEDWQELGTDKDQVLLKPMHTKILLEQIESLLDKHEARLEAVLATLKSGRAAGAATSSEGDAPKVPTKKIAAKRPAIKKPVAQKTAAKKIPTKKVPSKSRQAR